jgi:putative SOS response-associated peptidase YedK
MYFAALFDVWKRPLPTSRSSDKDKDKDKDNTEPDVLYSFTILTTSATDDFAKIHSRLPMILTKDQVPMWLNCKKYPITTFKQLLSCPTTVQLNYYR